MIYCFSVQREKTSGGALRFCVSRIAYPMRRVIHGHFIFVSVFRVSGVLLSRTRCCASTQRNIFNGRARVQFKNYLRQFNACTPRAYVLSAKYRRHYLDGKSNGRPSPLTGRLFFCYFSTWLTNRTC